MLLRHPTSTLFPYTTLFRSLNLRPTEMARARSTRSNNNSANIGFEQKLWLAADSRSEVETAEGDRKSTRLNSSHTVISYAVFCLKKKNEHDLDAVQVDEACE